MKKFISILFAIALIIPTVSCESNVTEGKPIIAAGIVPVASFIETVADGLVDVVTLIPPGNSPANYQPSSKEMQALSDAVIYFTMQMPTEEANILPKVSSFNKDIVIINLRDEASATYPLLSAEDHNHDGDHDEEHDGDNDDDNDEDHDEDHDEQAALSVDPHLWLSIKRSIVMVQAIADELSRIDSGNKDTYQKNAAEFIKTLESLDKEISIRIESLQNKAFMIYHGTYGYFADDYGLEMISIEVAGKQATASEIQEVIEHANEEGIRVVFYQDEFDDNQARTVADEIGGRVEKASPLSPDYTRSLLDFVTALEGARD